MDIHDFVHRRARPGKGARKKALMEELRMARTLLDHAIIAYMAGDPEGENKKAVARAEMDCIIFELTSITMEPNTAGA